MRKVKPIKPIGSDPVFIFSGLLDPSEVKPKTLPGKAGVYLLVACDDQGVPIDLPNAPAIRHGLRGVVYVGMTGSSNTLKRRFYLLARSWSNGSPLSRPHGSRKHYDGDSEAQRLFKPENVRVRYCPLPTDSTVELAALVDYADQVGKTVEELRQMFGTLRIADERVLAVEADLIQWFKFLSGYKPMLNKDDDGAKDPKATDEWIGDHTAGYEREPNLVSAYDQHGGELFIDSINLADEDEQ